MSNIEVTGTTRPCSALRNSHSAFLCLVMVLLAFSSAKLFADNPPPSSNRWLFIIDTSAGMKRHHADILSTVGNIITNAANSEMRSGDSLGLWTFNQDVYSDLPAQSWTGRDRDEIAQRTLTFLKKQRFVKTSRLDKALLDMQEVVRVSDIITIFIISDGHGKMTGTPFDDQINAIYRQDIEDMHGQSRAIVTVLQAQGGKLIHFTVNALPWPVVIPELPVSVHVAETAPSPWDTSAPETNQPPAVKPPMGKPLILSGPSAHSSTAAPTPASPPVVATTQATTPVPTPAPVVQTPAPVVTIPSTPPTATPQVNLAPSPAPPANLPVVPASATPNFTPPPSNASDAVTVAKHPGLPPPPPAVANNPSQTVVAKVNAGPAQSAPATAAHASVTNLSVTTAKAATNPPPLAESKSAAPIQVTAPATNKLAARAMAFVAPETPGATGRQKGLLIAAVALLAIGILLVVVIVRRSKTTFGPSLISRTMGDDRKR